MTAQDLTEKALSATRESRSIEFKQNLDPDSPAEWCEVVKDIVAIANSGGGILVFGLDSKGVPVGVDVRKLSNIDPADVLNKVRKYTGPVDLDLEVVSLNKLGNDLVGLLVGAAPLPLVFEKEGAYESAPKKTKTVFNVGTVYFRHGAKSEPGTTDDLRTALERQLEETRKAWLGNVRKVVTAPRGSHVVMVPAAKPGHSGVGGVPSALTAVVTSSDPAAIRVSLTRDPSKASGQFLHEQIAEGIFDEINNVIDANRVLARGNAKFLLGFEVYHRVYAERQYVHQNVSDLNQLLRSGICDIYGPGLFWMTLLPDDAVAEAFCALYVESKHPNIYWLVRLAALLGRDLSDWLWERWRRKWENVNQRPSYYWALKEGREMAVAVSPILAAARVAPAAQFQKEGGAVTATQLLSSPEIASSLLSNACMRVFKGRQGRDEARALDFLAYGSEVQRRAKSLSAAIIAAIGEREPREAAAAGDT